MPIAHRIPRASPAARRASRRAELAEVHHLPVPSPPAPAPVEPPISPEVQEAFAIVTSALMRMTTSQPPESALAKLQGLRALLGA